mmetsp:Transcript_65013/g.169130  ORF Transcript_65013/g.169130 Transcript_65013/m.169130 type:complete len:428 (+) Transcript_65013:224-1507(+)
MHGWPGRPSGGSLAAPEEAPKDLAERGPLLDAEERHGADLHVPLLVAGHHHQPLRTLGHLRAREVELQIFARLAQQLHGRLRRRQPLAARRPPQGVVVQARLVQGPLDAHWPLHEARARVAVVEFDAPRPDARHVQGHARGGARLGLLFAVPGGRGRPGGALLEQGGGGVVVGDPRRQRLVGRALPVGGLGLGLLRRWLRAESAQRRAGGGDCGPRRAELRGPRRALTKGVDEVRVAPEGQEGLLARDPLQDGRVPVLAAVRQAGQVLAEAVLVGEGARRGGGLGRRDDVYGRGLGLQGEHRAAGHGEGKVAAVHLEPAVSLVEAADYGAPGQRLHGVVLVAKALGEAVREAAHLLAQFLVAGLHRVVRPLLARDLDGPLPRADELHRARRGPRLHVGPLGDGVAARRPLRRSVGRRRVGPGLLALE